MLGDSCQLCVIFLEDSASVGDSAVRPASDRGGYEYED